MSCDKILGIRVNTKGIQIALLKVENAQSLNCELAYYATPAIYTFLEDISKILKWHRNHLITTIYSEQIKYMAFKRIERNSFMGRPKDNDIQKMYLEGMSISLAGENNLINQGYYKTSINNLLESRDYVEYFDTICQQYDLAFEGPLDDLQKDAISVAISLAKQNSLL